MCQVLRNDVGPSAASDVIDPMYGRPCVARGFLRSGGCAVLHQVSGHLSVLCSRPSWISARLRSSLPGRPRPGHLGHQCSQAPGRPILHLVLSFRTGGRNDTSTTQFRTPRPSNICGMPRCRAVLSRTHMLADGDRNLCIRNLYPAGFTAVVPCEERSRARACWSPAHDLLPLFAPHDSGRPNRARFLMRRFESCRPSQPVRSL